MFTASPKTDNVSLASKLAGLPLPQHPAGFLELQRATCTMNGMLYPALKVARLHAVEYRLSAKRQHCLWFYPNNCWSSPHHQTNKAGVAAGVASIIAGAKTA